MDAIIININVGALIHLGLFYIPFGKPWIIFLKTIKKEIVNITFTEKTNIEIRQLQLPHLFR